MSSSRMVLAWSILLSNVFVGLSDANAQPSLEGKHELEKSIQGQFVVVTAYFVKEPVCHNPKSWLWGSDLQCPKQVIGSLAITWGEQELFIPASAYMDLAAVYHLAIEPASQGFTVNIRGGDASTSYRAVLEFEGVPVPDIAGVLKRRIVRSGEFPGDAWEETRYTFNTGAEPEPPIR